MIDYGEGIRLETLDRKHLALIRAWRNDPRILEWCRQSDLINEIRHAEWFEQQAIDRSIRMYVIKEIRGYVVGVCGLTSIDLANQRAEFSLYIGPNWQKKGYAKAALKTLVSHGFNTLPLNVIWGESFAGNPAHDLFTALGFQEEGIRRNFYFKDGESIDAHLFSLLRSEWMNCDVYKKEPVCSTSDSSAGRSSVPEASHLEGFFPSGRLERMPQVPAEMTMVIYPPGFLGSQPSKRDDL